jgi:hypothetical protein
MKPRDAFDVAVKTIGLIAVLYGALSLLDGALILTELANVSHSTPKYWAIRGAGQVFAGLLLLRGSHKIVDFAFLDTVQPEETEPNDKVDGS